MMSRWHGFFRESAGPGWALVGDAGHFKDPTPGQGISDALRQSVELAGAIESALGGSSDADRVLRDWWSWRDADAWEMYWFAQDMGDPDRAPRLSARDRGAHGRRPAAGREACCASSTTKSDPRRCSRRDWGWRALATALRTGRGHRRELLGEARNARRRRNAPRPAAEIQTVGVLTAARPL